MLIIWELYLKKSGQTHYYFVFNLGKVKRSCCPETKFMLTSSNVILQAIFKHLQIDPSARALCA